VPQLLAFYYPASLLFFTREITPASPAFGKCMWLEGCRVRIADGFGVIVKFEGNGMVATVELDEGRSHRSVPISMLNNVPPKESNTVRDASDCRFRCCCVNNNTANFCQQGSRAFVIEGHCQVQATMFVCYFSRHFSMQWAGPHRQGRCRVWDRRHHGL
jgi:hypothetical protein